LPPGPNRKATSWGGAFVSRPRIRRNDPRQTAKRRPSRGRTNRDARARSASERTFHWSNCSRSPQSGLGSRSTRNTHVAPASGRASFMPDTQSQSCGGICRLRSSISLFYPSRRPARKGTIMLQPTALAACPHLDPSSSVSGSDLAEIVQLGCLPLGRLAGEWLTINPARKKRM